jgi:hypothetical protein
VTRLRIVLLFSVSLMVIAAACGGTETGAPGGAEGTTAIESEQRSFPDGAFAVRANRDITVGRERLLVGVRQADGGVLGSPDQVVELEVRPVDDPSAAVQRATAGFSWIIPDVSGLYRATFEFDRAGVWQAAVIPASGPALEPALFSVLDPSCATSVSDQGGPLCAVRVGETAPAIPSPTLESAAIDEISTDPTPDERLYQISLDEAVANGRPTVVVFATPAFCTTAACGPLVDIVQERLDDYPTVDFVHVEVFTGFREEGFDPADPARLAPAVAAYRLVSEPWVYVVDADGIVSARFEGVMSGEELDQALAG